MYVFCALVWHADHMLAHMTHTHAHVHTNKLTTHNTARKAQDGPNTL